MLTSKELIKKLSDSQLFRDYEEAFSEATRLPLALRPHEMWQHALKGKKNANAFCILMAESNRSCAACLEVQQELMSHQKEMSSSVTCFAGLRDTVVPVSAGNQVIGFLQTGQIALKKPSKAGFLKVSEKLVKWGTTVDLSKIQDAYFHSKVLPKKQYEAMIRLLEVFARHLSEVANQIMVSEQHQEPPLITRAKLYIAENQTESISLNEIARSLHVSTFYFCKMFKKATGLTFTDYLSRTRIEKAKTLLLNPHARVSEIAFDCGFISLTHFNRMFKRVVGKSPTIYRETAALCKAEL